MAAHVEAAEHHRKARGHELQRQVPPTRVLVRLGSGDTDDRLDAVLFGLFPNGANRSGAPPPSGRKCRTALTTAEASRQVLRHPQTAHPMHRATTAPAILRTRVSIVTSSAPKSRAPLLAARGRDVNKMGPSSAVHL